MALRGHCGQAGAASSWTFPYSGASNIALGDLIMVVTHQNGGTGAFTVTGPGATFTPGASLSPTLGGLINGNAWDVSVAIAAAGDVGTPTYSTSSTVGGGSYVQQILVYSGRINSSVAAAFSNSAMTAGSANQTTATATYSMTGLTALAGDDLVIVNPINVGGGGLGQTYATALTGYGDALATNGNSGATNPAMNALDLVNSPAGATGTLGVGVTLSGGTANNWYIGGFVIALPAAALPPSTSAAPILLLGV